MGTNEVTGKQLRVTQVRSGIGSKPKAVGTLRALGLGRIGKTHVLPDTKDVRGMINRVPHLIKVEDVHEGPER
jgi:large subunit ribosomal protein L30